MSPKSIDETRLDRVVAEARRAREQRDRGYREQALKLYPWICGRCAREFTRANLHELTVHHRDHDHDNNPEDGSNWELLSLYCHDDDHQDAVERTPGSGKSQVGPAEPTLGFNAFEGLKDLLGGKAADATGQKEQ